MKIDLTDESTWFYESEKQSILAQQQEEYETFWSKREFLQFTHQLAKSKLKNPWGMLMINLTRIVSAVDPMVVLPETITSANGSLNLFTVLYGPSGAGKSTAVDVSRAFLMVTNPAPVFPMPSGEGLTEIFVNRQGNPAERRALVLVDEAGGMAEATKRKGTTVMGILREMWAGVDTGQQNADAGRKRRLKRHSYRLCFLLGMQERLSSFLINDEQMNLGTPQRFIWAQVNDPAVTKETRGLVPPPPDLMTWNMPGWAIYVPHHASLVDDLAPEPMTSMAYEADVLTLINDLLFDQTLGGADVDELDSHRVYMRCKLAAAMALTEGRRQINMEDWNLGGAILEMSDRNRAGLQRAARKIDARDVEKKTYAEASQEKRKEQIGENIETRQAEALVDKWKTRFAGETKNHGDLTRAAQTATKAVRALAMGMLKEDSTVVKGKNQSPTMKATTYTFPCSS